jgi:hypothetical protein
MQECKRNREMERPLIKYATALVMAALLLSTDLSGQEIRISFTAGAGTYRMQSLKSYIGIVNESLPFSPDVVDAFPPSPWYSAEAAFSMGDFIWGIAVSYNSTGSRVSLKDYSGEYLSDRRLSAISPGFTAGYLLPPLSERVSLTPGAILGVAFSTMKVDETLLIGTELINDYHEDFGAISLFSGPSLRLAWRVTSALSLELQTGYILHFGGGYFKPQKDRDEWMVSYEVHPDWDGLRCGLSVAVKIR